MTYPLVEHGGTGPVLHWAPATGFPPATYRPVLSLLARRFRCVSIPPRPLWPEIGPPPAEPGSWEEFGEDIDAGLREHGLGDAILVGHSFGGVASMVAAIRHPGRYRALILLDPTILPEEIFQRFVAGRAHGWKPPYQHPLAARARDRRSEFPSRQEAFDLWRSRPLFRDWPDASLWCYVDAALRPVPGGFTLVWTGPWEAHSYESIYLGSWDEVPRLPPELPVLVINGGASDTFGAASAAKFHGLAPAAAMETIAGFGHLFPLAAPEETARRILAWTDGRVGATLGSRSIEEAS